MRDVFLALEHEGHQHLLFGGVYHGLLLLRFALAASLALLLAPLQGQVLGSASQALVIVLLALVFQRNQGCR